MKFYASIWLLLLVSVAGCSVNERGIVIHWPGEATNPTVNPVAPIISHEFRCLILYDAQHTAKLPPIQFAMLFGKDVRDFLKTNCVKDSDGNPEYRIVDGTPDTTKTFIGVWAEMVAKNPPKTLPWIILTNGSAVLAEDLPTEWAPMTAALNQYAGVSP